MGSRQGGAGATARRLALAPSAAVCGAVHAGAGWIHGQGGVGGVGADVWEEGDGPPQAENF
jgi:hypothetical protein